MFRVNCAIIDRAECPYCGSEKIEYYGQHKPFKSAMREEEVYICKKITCRKIHYRAWLDGDFKNKD